MNKVGKNKVVVCDYKACPWNRENRCVDETLTITGGQCLAYMKRSERSRTVKRLMDDVEQGRQREL